MHKHAVKHLLYYSTTASTPQPSAISVISPHKAANQVRADQSPTTQASREHQVYCSTARTVQHSTAQHSTAQRKQPAQSRKASKTCRSQCDSANKQIWRASTCRAIFSTLSYHDGRINQNMPGLQIDTSTAVITQRWCDARMICLYCTAVVYSFDLSKIR